MSHVNIKTAETTTFFNGLLVAQYLNALKSAQTPVEGESLIDRIGNGAILNVYCLAGERP